jgi:alpha-1,3-mannosyltransferase
MAVQQGRIKSSSDGRQTTNLRGSTRNSNSYAQLEQSTKQQQQGNFVQRLYEASVLNPHSDAIFFSLLIVAELLLSIVIIRRVSYTEIDWQAYMQEVQTWQDGETDYLHIRGDTGPLVYPAGFLYLFALLKYWTRNGKDIRQAQYLFMALYLATQGLVLALFQQRITSIRRQYSSKSNLSWIHKVWSWRVAMGCLCLSKRLHSIFILRLFNDGPTMMVLYLSILLMTRSKWNLGCFVFSLAVSLKMNVLLFAPGLLLLLLQVSPNLKTVLQRLFVFCALPQLILGAPFLTTHPISYLRKAFELDRVFFYQWTVNLKFLPESMFLSRAWALLLLMGHLLTLGYCAFQWRQSSHKSWLFLAQPLSPHYIVYTLLVSNFVGICFARTLHYQFYVRTVLYRMQNRHITIQELQTCLSYIFSLSLLPLRVSISY